MARARAETHFREGGSCDQHGTASVCQLRHDLGNHPQHSLDKLPLPEVPRLWIPRRLDFFQIEILPLQPESVYLSGELPPMHRDPFDRLIAAESIHRRIPVITCDKPFSDLGANRIW